MTAYKYKALSRDGSKVSGVVDHPTPQDKNRIGLMMTKVGG